MHIIIETRLLWYVLDGFLFTSEHIKGGYQKRKKFAVQDQCDSNSQGGH